MKARDFPRVHGLMKPIVISFFAPCGHPYGTKTSQMRCACPIGVSILLILYHTCKKKTKQHSAGFHSGPFRDHSSANSRMALFHQNKWSLEWQFWQGSLPKIILPDSTGFWQESQGHDKDLLFRYRFKGGYFSKRKILDIA